MDDQGWDREAWLSDGIGVGSRWSCDNRGHVYDRRIHIQYPDQPCTCRNQGPDDLHITLVEKQLLGFELLDEIAEYARKRGSIYVHCKAGMCRGPTVAVVVLLARYGTGFQRWGVGRAMGGVSDAMMSQYKWCPIVPEFDRQVITEIYQWNKQRAARSTPHTVPE
jgi:hypothetical protein